MNSKKLFFQTLIISVIIQLLTGVFEIGSLFIKVPSEFTIIRQLLIMEITVQFIEGLFYLWLVLNFKHVTDVTPKRYIDWSITTPTMLITLIFYLIFSYEKEKQKGNTTTLNFFDLLLQNSCTIRNILLLNWLMLIFGYLGEKKIIPTITGVILGFIPFFIYFLIIYINFVKTQFGFYLFLYFFIFWSLYGLVAFLPYYLKNALYNILDLFSKNFFGVFLSYTIFTGNY